METLLQLNLEMLIILDIMVTILILVETLLQFMWQSNLRWLHLVTILILVETLLQCNQKAWNQKRKGVTILILVETLLQSKVDLKDYVVSKCHNPYFSGNSFAIVAKFSSFYPFNASEPVIFQLRVGIKKIPTHI